MPIVGEGFSDGSGVEVEGSAASAAAAPAEAAAEDDPRAAVAGVESTARVLRTPCGDGDLVWRCWGDGEPLVLLHGGHGSWMHWIRNVGSLSREFRLLVPDMPGYGSSAVPPAPYSPASLAAILAAGLDAILGPAARFHLVGFSFGGTVSGELALQRQANTRRLVIVGTSTLAPPGGARPELVTWRNAADPVEANRENLRRMMIADPRKIDALAVHIQTENTRAARISSRRFRGLDLLNRALSQLAMPLAGIWGGADVLGRHGLEAIAARLRAQDPEAAFEIVEGAGHWAAYERPRAFDAALLRVLRRPA